MEITEKIMGLFKSEDLKDELLPVETLESGKVVEEDGYFDNLSNPLGLMRLGRLNERLESVMGDWDMKQDLHYVSHGHWSLHNLLEWILPRTGPANIYIATWSMSEEATRVLINLCETGLIHKIEAILDFRTKNRHEGAFFLAKTNFNKIHSTACHAKVTVIENKDYTLTINGSPNYTNNPRIESGVISVSKEVGKFHIGWITDVMNNVSVFE